MLRVDISWRISSKSKVRKNREDDSSINSRNSPTFDVELTENGTYPCGSSRSVDRAAAYYLIGVAN